MSVRTLRFEPYPASMDESRKPIYNPDGTTNWTGAMDIPEDSDVRIESLPSRHVVFEGKVSGSISRNFAPGKYIYVMEKFIAPRRDGSMGRSICTHGTFLVDVSDEQWTALQDASPKMVRGTQTTEGPRLMCTAPGCNKRSETRLEAFIHESKEHFGVDPLKDPHRAAEVEIKAQSAKAKIARGKERALDDAAGLSTDSKVVL